MPTKPVWVPTVVRSCELGFIKRWDAIPPEADFVMYRCKRHRDGNISVFATYREAIAFITDDQTCPVLDLYN